MSDSAGAQPFSRQEILAEDEIMIGCAVDRILDHLPDRLHHGILKWAAESPDAAAVVSSHGTLTYAALDQAVTEAREALQTAGVREGDRVMLVAENGAALMCLVLAMSQLDGVAVVINARLSARELDLIRQDCEPRVVVFTAADSPAAAEHAAAEETRALGLRTGDALVTKPADVDPERAGESPEDQVLAMIYTTGTTGKPKGVMLTHRNLTFTAFVSGKLRGIRAGDAVYCVLPMSHVFGLSAVSASVLFAGGTVHLVPRFDAAEVLRALRDESIVGFLGVPAMYAAMLDALSHQPDYYAPSLRFFYAGGSPLDPDIKRRVEAAFGMPLHNGYGLTESGPTICQTRLFAPLVNTSVGFVLPGVEVRILDKDGNPVEDGEVGELWARGPNIMKGYFRQPEMTSAVLKEGWFNTGDLVRVDEVGAINIAGRTKELIIRSGFNVYPPEVESVLTEHPDVSIAAVVGRDRDGDEEIVAYVQPSAGAAIDVAALMAFARERLAGYKVPNRIEVMAVLPAAPSGKILKHQLT